MNNIQIVTAFYDNGRGNLQGPMRRTNEEYLSYFKMLCLLENDIVVFTSPDLMGKIKEAAGDKQNIKVLEYEIFNRNKDYIDRIRDVQGREAFKAQFPEEQLLNIEYWSPEYIFINMMKSNYVNRAYELELVAGPVAWIDFGFFRNMSQVPENRMWQVEPEPNKISIFSCKPFEMETLEDAIGLSKENIMYIVGTILRGDRKSWGLFEKYIFEAQNVMMKYDLVDDDQGIMLVAYLLHRELFKVYDMGQPYFDSVCSIRNLLKYFINDVSDFAYPEGKTDEWRFPGMPDRGN